MFVFMKTSKPSRSVDGFIKIESAFKKYVAKEVSVDTKF